jgi:hypothetical protein
LNDSVWDQKPLDNAGRKQLWLAVYVIEQQYAEAKQETREAELLAE